jgi:hypothetical protein
MRNKPVKQIVPLKCAYFGMIAFILLLDMRDFPAPVRRSGNITLNFPIARKHNKW